MSAAPARWPRRILLVLAGAFAAAALAAAAVALPRKPTYQHLYRADQAVLPEITVQGHLASIRHIRDFRTLADGTQRPGWYDATYDLDGVRRVWFGLSPFAKVWRGPAHAFASFEFDDGRFLAVSFEARKDEGESYSTILGALRQYELMVVIADERDLVGLRAVTWHDPVYLYPVRATPAQARAFLLRLLERAERLRTRPEFYNTVTSNCTSNLESEGNAVLPHRLRAGIEQLVPGYADRYALRDSLIDTTLGLDAARRRFRVNADTAARYRDDPAFSARIRGRS